MHLLFFGFLGNRSGGGRCSAMELTLRQKAFFDKLVDLYREAQRPVH